MKSMIDWQESEQERNYRKKQEAIREAEIKNQQERERKMREMYGILTKEHNKVDGELWIMMNGLFGRQNQNINWVQILPRSKNWQLS